jgi:hypothetical protein
MQFFTIGHSNPTLEEFVELLRVPRVDCIIDVRKMPMSRTNPRFNKDALPKARAPFRSVAREAGRRLLPPKMHSRVTILAHIPGNFHAARLIGQRAAFGRVGCQLVEDHAKGERRLRCKVEGCPVHLPAVLADSEGLE